MSLRPIVKVLLFVVLGWLASCEALAAAADARMAMIRTYRISGQINTSSLGTQSFEGTFQLDQFGLSGVGVETLPATAMTNFQLSVFGAQFGPVSGPGTAEFVDGKLNRILVVVSVPTAYEANQTRAVGFSAGFGPEGVPDDGTGRWVGCLDPRTFIDGFGTYQLQEITPQ